MNEKLQTMLEKLPLVPLILLFAGYLGYDYYTFVTDPSSDLSTKTQQLNAAQQELTATRQKVKAAQEFYRTLETRRGELRNLALQLEEAKASLSEQMDVSSFIRLVMGEANKVGLTPLGIKPTDTHDEEYYSQQSFEMAFRGVYVQLRVFLERISNLERIIRVGEAHIKPISSANASYVQLEGKIVLNTFRYLGSKADELGKENATGANSSSKSQGTAAPKKGGAS